MSQTISIEFILIGKKKEKKGYHNKHTISNKGKPFIFSYTLQPKQAKQFQKAYNKSKKNAI
jgi:hypothetical protein